MSITRDRVGELLLALDSTNGRDRLVRFFQFAAMYLKYQSIYKSNNHSVNQTNKMTQVAANVQASMSTTRKILRLFRSIAILRSINQSINQSVDQKITAEFAFNLLARICLFWYLTFDHLTLANRLGIWSFDQSNNQSNNQSSNQGLFTLSITPDRLNWLTEGSWLGEIIFTILEQLIRLHALNKQHSHNQSINQSISSSLIVTGSGVVVATGAFNHAIHHAMKSQCYRTLIRNILDLPIALHFLGLIDRLNDYKSQSKDGMFDCLIDRLIDCKEGAVGFCGMLSSLMGLYEIWPTVLTPTKKKVD